MTFIPDVDRLTLPDPTDMVVSRFLEEGKVPSLGKVLLVDDNQVVLMSLGMVLERGGFDVSPHPM